MRCTHCGSLLWCTHIHAHNAEIGEKASKTKINAGHVRSLLVSKKTKKTYVGLLEAFLQTLSKEWSAFKGAGTQNFA